jgi:hypothetical protein
MANPVSENDTNAINHITYVADSMHSLTNDRDHDLAKEKAKYIITLMNDLIKSLSDEI